METQDTITHAFCMLTMAYPNAPLGMVNYAVSVYWNPSDTDENNIESCKYLEQL